MKKRQKNPKAKRPLSVPFSASGQRLPRPAPWPIETAAFPGAERACEAAAFSVSLDERRWGPVQALGRGLAGNLHPWADTYTSPPPPGPARCN